MRQLAALLASLVVAVVLCLPSLSFAQDYPAKPIRIIVPLTTGGIASIFTRYLGDQFTARWKQPVVVEYKPGGGMFIGHDFVSRADPDGYTLVITADSASAMRLFMKSANFDPAKDLAPISMLVRSPYVLQSPAELPPRSMKEFLAYVKANPGKFNVGSVPNSQGMLWTVLFLKRAGLDMTVIPYNGGAPNLTALLANQIQLYFGNYGTSLPHLKAGKLIALAATSGERYFLAPDVPTLKETGIDMSFGFWFALAAPAATPRPIIDKLALATAEIMKSPDAVEKMKAIGLEAVGSTPAELARATAEGAAAAQEAVNIAGIKPE